MIHLHIGRHKTGTSALQHFLAANRETLAQLGYEYPASLDGSPAHHALARSLPQLSAKPAALPREADPREPERFAALGRDHQHLIVSSERFQSADPAAVRALWPGRPVEVIVYLREPLAYMLSSYAQAVHARTVRTPLVNHAAKFRPDYPGFIARWTEAFGSEAVRVRLYERERLEDGDIRRDFVRLLGLDPGRLDFTRVESNPSLGAELIEFKGLVNAVLPAERQSRLKLYVLLSRLTGRFPEPLAVSPAFAEAYRRNFRQANSALLSQFTAGQAAGFAERPTDRTPPPIDLAESRGWVLQAITEIAPNVGRVLRRELPGDLGEVGPLLPTDWDAATAELQAAGAGSGA